MSNGVKHDGVDAVPQELKPCPFCGSKNVTTEPNYDESYVHCFNCGADGPAGNYIECEEKWNTRPTEVLSKAYGAAQAVITLAIDKQKL